MKLILLSLLICITSNLLSQRTARPNPYIAKNISYDSDTENKKINRLNNLKGEVSNLTTYVCSISLDKEKFDNQKSFKYSFNKNRAISSEWKFKQVDQPDKKISYQSFIRNRRAKVELFIADGQVDVEEFQYDEYNRLIKTSKAIAGQKADVLIPISIGDSLDIFHIEGKIYKYDEDRLMIIEQENSKMSERYFYRRDNSLESKGNYKKVGVMSGSWIPINDSMYHQGRDAVRLSPKGWVRGVWKSTFNAGNEWLASLGTYYDYNDNGQVSKKVSRRIKVLDVRWQIDSTTFTYIYNDEKLLESITKDNNQTKPMVTFDYNQHGDLIYSTSPAGELKYIYSDYDDLNNWRTREKYLNGALVMKEERVIEYFE